jgi:hypothetical protein
VSRLKPGPGLVDDDVCARQPRVKRRIRGKTKRDMRIARILLCGTVEILSLAVLAGQGRQIGA